MHYSRGGDVSFLPRSVKEGGGEDGNGYCVPDVQESIYQGVLVLVMSSSSSFDSRDKARLSGRTGNVLISVWSARLDSCQNRPDKGWDLTSFLSLQQT